eukprot:2347308-Pleurochrysis_carterae.AAC.1
MSGREAGAPAWGQDCWRVRKSYAKRDDDDRIADEQRHPQVPAPASERGRRLAESESEAEQILGNKVCRIWERRSAEFGKEGLQHWGTKLRELREQWHVLHFSFFTGMQELPQSAAWVFECAHLYMHSAVSRRGPSGFAELLARVRVRVRLRASLRARKREARVQKRATLVVVAGTVVVMRIKGSGEEKSFTTFTKLSSQFGHARKSRPSEEILNFQISKRKNIDDTLAKFTEGARPSNGRIETIIS